MTKKIHSVLLAGLLLLAGGAGAQTVSDAHNKPVNVDSAVAAAPLSHDRQIDSLLRYHTPKKAAIRSAILPGLGQIYNGKYWKLPLVYTAIGIPTAMFIYNLTWYKRTREAYTILATHDVARYPEIHEKLQGYVRYNNAAGVQALRNQFRRDVDFSFLYIVLAWGLNVVDATVDAHLKSFDVSPDLSLRMKAGYSELAQTNGLSLVLSFH
ncbi:hypothetical protein EPD60_15710 [Flaviaesturariibacter flavus]|uniref:DUF5683 domain-containing protein n=1 Tax=Flaviaesturariibacter flavus TaxID=2502780 RepID=A0A4R1B1U3_9BACT|nr:DUF5683 domain-containing protein [Flaviaesturariibacter flavus]TCJ12002.1 hypothetical protein EPD60_15710 [Flaviaesturariibacter flavus]